MLSASDNERLTKTGAGGGAFGAPGRTLRAFETYSESEL
jgi:hypothetical protein